MAVVVIGSLDGLSIEEAAVRLFSLWGIGGKSKDNGLLLIWSTGDRRVRVEVGYGLEGVLPDGKTGAILDAYVIPKFKSGQFDEGVLAGVDALLRAARNETVELPSEGTESYESGSPGIGTLLIGLLGAIPVGLGSMWVFGSCGDTIAAAARHVRRAWSAWTKPKTTRCSAKASRQRSAWPALITMCGSARPVRIISRFGTRNGSAASPSAHSATTARSHPLRRSSSLRAPPAAAARASSSSARSAASTGSTRRSFRASPRRAPHRRAVRRAPAVSAAAVRAAAEPVEDIRRSRLARSMPSEGWPHLTPGCFAPCSRAD